MTGIVARLNLIQGGFNLLPEGVQVAEIRKFKTPGNRPEDLISCLGRTSRTAGKGQKIRRNLWIPPHSLITQGNPDFNPLGFHSQLHFDAAQEKDFHGNPASTSYPLHSKNSKGKKAPVLWEKDTKVGVTSICILLDWLAVEGNYWRWRGDTKHGSTKSALANEILALMVDAGITHQDNKGIQTRIQDLQLSYSKACDYL
ncbi:hypothetical protein PCASD_19992 [Puccinia coronata f. sp. avenae]|uniref:Uncharacterized protein n=1 Tax=Puccinia coronata f. sp. avenae TaxID=200324 RepID=A0A2N5TXV8_9BASI|nr:hypothetical protein PCASD_19992 [Puccinia coronata f. sp. avenae]